MTKRRLPMILALVALASAALAWVEDRPDGATFQPEQSQAQVEQQQRAQHEIGEVGRVPRRKGDTRIDVGSTDAEAGDNLAVAEELPKGSEEDERGGAVIRDASTQKGDGSSRGPAWWWGLVVALVGFGAFLALKVYADRTIPEPPKHRPVKW